MVPPAAEDYIEPDWKGRGAGSSTDADPKEWLTGRARQSLEALHTTMRSDGVLYHAIKRELATSGKTLDEVRRTAAPEINKYLQTYSQLAQRQWDEMAWAVIATVAKESSNAEAQKAALVKGEAAPGAKPAGRPVAKPDASLTTNVAASPTVSPAATAQAVLTRATMAATEKASV